MDSVLEPIILKRKSNLSQFRVDSTVYQQRELDYENEGTPIIDEKFNPTMSLLGSMQNLTPQYDSDRNKWAFYGELEDLQRIAKALSLEDPLTKKIITVDESSLTNRFDPFWGHPTLWRSVFIEENARYLEANTPLDELYIRILRGREDIQQPDRKDQSTFDTDKSNLELISPNIDKKNKLVNSAKKKRAMQLFIEYSAKVDEFKVIANILNHEDLDSAKDQESLEALIMNEYVNNDELIKKHNMTALDYFISICELSKEDKIVYQLAIDAIKLGIIRVSVSEGYLYKGERINYGNIKSDMDLFKYLKNQNNTKFFLMIEKAVDAAKLLK